MGCAQLQAGRARHDCYMLTAGCSKKPMIDHALHTSLFWSYPVTPLPAIVNAAAAEVAGVAAAAAGFRDSDC